MALNYQYFADRATFPFSLPVNVERFDSNFAAWMAELSLLAYALPGAIRLAVAGLGYGWSVKWLGVDEGFIIEAPCYAIIVPCGTRLHEGGADALIDLLTDGDAKPVKEGPQTNAFVHQGFRDRLDQHWPVIQAAVAEKPSYWTGHSLGAAESIIGAYRAHHLGYPVRCAYTFGCPRPGLSGFVDRIQYPHFRLIHGNDGIPHLPEPSTLWKQSGTEMHLSGEGERLTHVGHKIGGYLRAWLLRYVGRFESLLKDHNMSGYSEAVIKLREKE